MTTIISNNESQESSYFGVEPLLETHEIEDSKLALQYQEVIRRLPAGELSEVQEKVSQVTDSEIEVLVRTIDSHQWHATLFTQNEYPYQALAALRKGKITVQQFATIMFYWVNFTKRGIQGKMVLLFNADGTVNKEARDLIAETATTRSQTVLTDQEIDELFEEMRKQPVSEQCFFISHNPKSASLTIVDTIIEGIKFNLFGKLKEGTLIPSLSLMQASIKVRFKDQSIEINPVMGLSTEDDLFNAAPAKRDMAIPFPGVTLPDTADGLPAKDQEFIYHDFAHMWWLANTPISHREKRRDMFKYLQQQYSNHPFAKALASVLVDMEGSTYELAFKGYSPATLQKDQTDLMFWFACERLFFLILITDESRSQRFPDVPPLHPLIMAGHQLLLSEEEKKIVKSLAPFFPLSEETKKKIVADNDKQVQEAIESINDAKRDPILEKKACDFLYLFKTHSFFPILAEG
ncbi:MAG TPA: hypothetical protein VHA52_11675 [Candidatus Babeliaceae bacterium]|nr:hypothetical protein [Candidatus Babeliaceae bacterium]